MDERIAAAREALGSECVILGHDPSVRVLVLEAGGWDSNPLIHIPIGIGMIVVPVALSAIAGVGFDQIGPTSAIALMLQNLGGPVVLAVIQAVITSRTLYLGGTNGPVKFMNKAQLHALDQGYTYGLLWVAGVAVIVGGVSLLIGYSAEQVAHAQEVKDAIDAGDL